ncbi:hypothetical protein BXZ70DRAFT_334566 [Cristinia sonorae]|uniref:Tail specific protease domain-containing protein n=1 Tax=Cristinia sonorae TaxID=1940300 RepID=A0A8K0XND7_9AGAR|nr:hypothetical protein BXZ70DRAFT_334566 [Cristinia sonorae]
MLFKTAVVASVIYNALSVSGASISVRQTEEAGTEHWPHQPERDFCAPLAFQKWTNPKDVRACLTSVSVAPINKIRDNIIEVISKTLSEFHTTLAYEKRSPSPFDVRVDLDDEFARIKRTRYDTEWDLHLDISKTVKRLKNGHAVYINPCYDSEWQSFLPTPLVPLTDKRGKQDIYIAPEAFTVISNAFPEAVDFWQKSLPGNLKGKLASLSGAKVLKINGRDPWDVVEANTDAAGSFAARSLRQNGFFGSYNQVAGGFSYVFGSFAQTPLPIADSVTLTIQRTNSTKQETITIPYRTRHVSDVWPWSDKASYISYRCVAQPSTNGVDLIHHEDQLVRAANVTITTPPVSAFQQQPSISAEDRQAHPLSVLVDNDIRTEIPYAVKDEAGVAKAISVAGLTSPVDIGGGGNAEFYMLSDGKTGVLSLGSFSSRILTFAQYSGVLLTGIELLRDAGATQLIVDVTNNSGGFICMAHWLYRILAGPKAETDRAGTWPTMFRAGDLAQEIVKTIAVENWDPDGNLFYGPTRWVYPNTTYFDPNFNFLARTERRTINGEKVEFGSQKVWDNCFGWPFAPPDKRPFDPKKIAIVSNGRCGSACASFAIPMVKREGTKTVVVGGKKGVQQQYAGMVGGQVSDFQEMDLEIKSTGHKKHKLAPPDFLVNGIQTISWRLALTGANQNEPEEFQDRPADYNIPLTTANVNNPFAIWDEVAKTVFKR